MRGHLYHCGVAYRAVEEMTEVTRSRQRKAPLLTELKPEGAKAEEGSCSSMLYDFFFFNEVKCTV